MTEMLVKIRQIMADELCMSVDSAIEFLEKVYEAKQIVNELTGWTRADGIYKTLSGIYKELDKLLSPICPDCHVRAERFITSPAQLYDPDMAELPGGTTPRWTGEWYCPKCSHLVTVGNKWWDTWKIGDKES